ncbi:MAG: FAD-dependent oxidoreductase [Propionibacteriaceae bacterium]
MEEYDVVVIGGGAAGLSAALVLSRVRRDVLVVDSGTPRNAPAAHMHGFLSRDSLPPGDLLALGRDEVLGYGGKMVDGAVTEVVPCGDTGFWVMLADGQRVSGRRLLVATGLRDELLGIPGLRGGIPAFTVGLLGFVLFIGVLTERSRSIWPSVLAHGSWNWLVQSYFSSSGAVENRVFTGSRNLLGEFGWLGAVGMLILWRRVRVVAFPYSNQGRFVRRSRPVTSHRGCGCGSATPPKR